MTHIAFQIEQWKNVNSQNRVDLAYVEEMTVGFPNLEINSKKLYFFLKQKYGSPSIEYPSLAKFFPFRTIGVTKMWCYLFQSGSYFIIISGDDLVHITVLSISNPPLENDFNLFCKFINQILVNTSLTQYSKNRYDIYMNYSYFLKNLIDKYKSSISSAINDLPDPLFINVNENLEDNQTKFKIFEYNRDYNNWLKEVLEKSTLTIQIQMLLPIHFESLVDLAFRVHLKKSLYNYSKIYGLDPYKLDIFSYFENLPLYQKIAQIKVKCNYIIIDKADFLIDKVKRSKFRKNRNKLLHGNSMFFKNLDQCFYFDKPYVIGLPDKANSYRFIAESIRNSVVKSPIDDEINEYTNLCQELIDIFQDDGYFKSVMSGISFGFNSMNGGASAIGINRIEDLFNSENI